MLRHANTLCSRLFCLGYLSLRVTRWSSPFPNRFSMTMVSPLARGKSHDSSFFSNQLKVVFFVWAATVCAFASETDKEPAKSSRVTEQVATCTAPDPDAPKPATLTGSISQAKPTFELVCSTERSNAAVPAGLEKVCKQIEASSANRVQSTPLSACSQDPTTQCLLSDLLFPGATAAWKPVTVTKGSGSTQTKYQLTISKDELPLLDQQFFVGCMKANEADSSCQVNITVNARASEVSADNVVTCAYGKESNKTPVAVTLTSETNSFTLKCGSEGTQTPAEKDSYCSGTSVDACDLKKLTSIIPKAEASWWADVVANQSMKFTIPTDKFPSADTVFLVGCKKPEKEKDATSCNVKVTVKSSAASGFQGAFSFGVVSAVVLAVLSGAVA
ncbi:srs domain-containing protein [Cystoisospora suis]|uniref:Srs domain-containing protein n=1 Tax=Cystoisospora suis TaxID=483139 RepID=A0A2C6KJU1_9APIC|nr:srs domain-containing protein [Cystoisospora suis]